MPRRGQGFSRPAEQRFDQDTGDARHIVHRHHQDADAALDRPGSRRQLRSARHLPRPRHLRQPERRRK